ncbi:MAG: N-acetyltransferase [Deltaproteobacteria bacterium]|nr:N-acetyltransferase [Deltaproteobacteria bacterium]
MIRKATVRDVEAIHRLLKQHAERGELLPRALSDLYDAGACALHVCWEDLAEIRSLAVSEPHQGEGVGSTLVKAALAEAEVLGIKRVFTLTYQPDFFSKHGFKVVDKAALPQKVWAECVKCVKFPDCDEIAMLKRLTAG